MYSSYLPVLPTLSFVSSSLPILMLPFDEKDNNFIIPLLATFVISRLLVHVTAYLLDSIDQEVMMNLAVMMIMKRCYFVMLIQNKVINYFGQ